MNLASEVIARLSENVTRVKSAHIEVSKYTRDKNITHFNAEIVKVAKILLNRIDGDSKTQIVKIAYDYDKEEQVNAILDKYGFKSN